MTVDQKPVTSPPRRSRWVMVIALIALVAALAGIWVTTHQAGGEPGARPAGGRGALGAGRNGGLNRPVPVLVGAVERADVPVELQAVGTVEASESVQVRPQVGGQVVAVGFQEGQPVQKGQMLYQLDTAPLVAAVRQAEATLARDRAQLAQAEADARRFRSLADQGFVARQQAEQAAASAAALRGTLQANQAQLENARVQLAYATIRAPIAGIAGERLLDVGNLARAGDTSPLVVINRVTPAMVRFAIPQREIDRVRRFQSQKPIAVTATARGGTPHTGTVVFLDHAVDPATGTLRLMARFPNADRALVPGQFADVSMTLTIEQGRTVAPTQGVAPSQQGHTVFVVNPDMTVSERTVKVERTAGDLTVIASGLAPGERIVTDGTLQLRDGAKVEIRKDLTPPARPAGGEGRRRQAP